MSTEKPASSTPVPVLLEANQQIVLPGPVALEALREIEYILISLRKISDHALFNPEFDFDAATAGFVVDGQVRNRLTKVRKLLSERFDNSLGADDMGDIERYVEDLTFWKPA